MCGRFASSTTDADLVNAFAVAETVGEQLAPSWNVAPTQQVRVVLDRTPRGQAADAPAADAPAADAPAAPAAAEPVRQLRTVRWGLVPSWAKDIKIGSRLVNARAETITEKPAFKAAAARRRCLLPADGYFEWEVREGQKAKQPYFLHRGNALLAFAGLYELWPDPALDPDDPARWVWSCTVLTTTAPDALGHIHERSPVLLTPELAGDWLDPSLTDPDRVRELLAAVPEPALEPTEVSTAVNNVRNNGPQLVRPAAAGTFAGGPPDEAGATA